MMKTPPKGGRGRGRGRGGRGGRGRGGYSDDFEGPPPKPLVKSENRWMPVKDTSVVAVTEKKVKSILNKMTKEKFEKLSEQMIEIPITSLEILTIMIHHVYEKAIFEPSFGDIYAELCIRLSEKAKRNPFVKIIESDEEPPTENGEAQDGKGTSSHNTVYRWSNDVSTDDSEVIGPFETVEECFEAALDADACPDPKKRSSEMVLHSVRIYAGQFIKVMHPVDNPEEFYTVFFPVSKAKEIGQQISDEIFLSEIECQKNGLKKNSFKSILLNKCQDEFKKKDIYDEWRIEKKAYDLQKDSYSESERLEKEEDLEYRRMKIKKQMLGNIRFIGELFKIEMLKVKVMRDCIESLLRLSQERDADGNLTGNIISLDDQDMDEEDHEAVCKLFTTIGSTIDRGKYTDIIDLYFSKISEFSNDKKLSARCRFLYKDLLDLRKNNWVARRKVEKAKTLDEIKKDFEREERIQGEQQNQNDQRNQSYRGMKDNRRGGKSSTDNRKGEGEFRHDSRDNRRASYDSSSRVRSTARDYTEPKPDASGFFPVTRSGGGRSALTAPPRILSRDDRGGSQLSKDSSRQSRSGPSPHQKSHQERHRQEFKPSHSKPTSEPLSKDKLQLRAKNMRLEFMQEKNEEELLRSMDDLNSTPNAGEVIVQTLTDAITECKIEEREAIISILSILYRNHRVTRNDISMSFAEIIEFLDSFIMDSPFALENVSCLMAEFLHIEALDVNWLCSNVQKLQQTAADLIPKVISSCLKSSINRYNVHEAGSHFEKASDALERLLTNEKWNEIKRKSDLVK
jgi:MIF4G domain.